MADYPISNVARRVVYTGSAGVGPYAFGFEVLENTDINVYKDDVLLTLTTDYTVTISALLGTGSITLVVAAVLANRITIVGSRPVERTTDFTTGGDFFANTLNDEMDSQTILVQQVAETAERSIKAPVTDPTNINMTLPINTSRAGKTLAFDADGNPVPGDPIGNWRGNWAASVSYQNRDIVKDTTNSNVYLVITAHTSSGALPISSNTDVAKWALVVDAAAAGTAQAAAEAAQAAAETAETNAETAETNAETAETNAETAETNAATSASNASTSASNAATSESNAATSASNASTSETNAAASAASAEPLPTQTGNAGKYLQTDGTDTTWEAVEPLPTQTGNAGKYLQTDGTDTTWEDAQTKLSGAVLTAVTVDAADKVLVQDASDSSNLKTVTAQSIADLGGGITLGTAIATTSGTSIDFTGIPAGVKRVTICFVGVSTTSTSFPLVQLGDSGGIETTGYQSVVGNRAAETQSTAGLVVYQSPSAASSLDGAVILTQENSTNNTWVMNVTMSQRDASISFGAGSKSLSTTLDRVRITTVGGTATFDAGSINISWE